MKRQKKKKILNSNGKPLNLREKVALSVFMESVPLLIELWKKSTTTSTFDEWLLSIHNDNKNKTGGIKQ